MVVATRWSATPRNSGTRRGAPRRSWWYAWSNSEGEQPWPSYVSRFSDGDKDQKDLLGGKGANLAEMTNLDLPVPPGFTITTEACRAYMRDGHAAAASCGSR